MSEEKEKPRGTTRGFQPGNTPTGGVPVTVQRARVEAEKKEIHEKVGREPDSSLEELAKHLTSLALKVTKQAERKAEVPSRATMDVIREFRQTLEAVNEARKTRGSLAESAAFLSEMDSRVQAAAASLALVPYPIAEVPA